jgi:hypothetical protein
MEGGRGESLPVSRMWNVSPFYLDLTGVYATHGCLESFLHFLGRPIDGMRRRDQCVVDRQRRNAINIRCSQRTQYQFAIDAHQAHAGIRAKGVPDRLVALLDGGQQLDGISTAHPRFVGKRSHRAPLIAGVQRDIETELNLIPRKIIDLVGVTVEFDTPFAVEDRGV